MLQKSLHETAIATGAELATAYEFNGSMQAATYTMTLPQLQSVAITHAAQLLAKAAQRLLAVPLKGRIGDWHAAQVQAQAFSAGAELLLSLQPDANPASRPLEPQ